MFKNFTPLPPDTEPKYLGIFTKNKTFYKGFFSLLVLIALQMLVTFCFLKADQLLKCIPNSIVANRYRWVKVLTK